MGFFIGFLTGGMLTFVMMCVLFASKDDKKGEYNNDNKF